jgi:hypothetical protein
VSQIGVDVLQVVGSCATDGDLIAQSLNRQARRGPPQ